MLGPVFGKPIDVAHWNENSPFVLAKKNAAALRKIAIYFNCGQDDNYGFEKGAAALHDELQKEGVSHQYHPYPGDHSLTYFLSHFAEVMEFHSHAFGLAATARLRIGIQRACCKLTKRAVLSPQACSSRRGGRVVDGSGLENRRTRKGTGGSNPSLSASFIVDRKLNDDHRNRTLNLDVLIDVLIWRLEAKTAQASAKPQTRSSASGVADAGSRGTATRIVLAAQRTLSPAGAAFRVLPAQTARSAALREATPPQAAEPHRAAPGKASTNAVVPAASAIQFENIIEQSKIKFKLKNSVSPQRYTFETMAGGVALFDYNNDGFLDIFFTNGAAIPSLEKSDPSYSNRLFRNNGDGTFTDVTEKAGLAGHRLFDGSCRRRLRQ